MALCFFASVSSGGIMNKPRTRAAVKQAFQPPCDECGGSCCRYIAIEIDKPTTKKDYDHIRWYLVHKDVNVFIDHDHIWHIEFRTPCEHQDKKNRCTIYERRPKICRDHAPEEGLCEYYDIPFTKYFTTEEEFLKYLDEKHVDWRFR